MGDPVTTTALFVASSAAKAAGQLTNGLSEAAQSRYQSHLYDAKAQTDAQASSLKEDMTRTQGRRDVSEQLARMAQAGGGNFGGSIGDVLKQSAADASWKALAGRWDGQVQVDDDHNQSLFQRAKARAQSQRGFFDALESGLGSLSQGQDQFGWFKPKLGADGLTEV